MKAIKGCSDLNGNLEAKCHSNEESKHKTVTNAQESKSEKAISESTDKKGETREPLEKSASTLINNSKREKSPRSSPDRKNPNSRKTKEGSEKAPVKKQGSRIPVHASQSPDIRMFVKSKLDLYTNKDGRYNGIIRILADAGFLQICYMLIKGKPGNMSKGATKETLDGISYEWFVNTANDILKGGFKFTPAMIRKRRVMIPKPGKREGFACFARKPLGVDALREKIIQKGMHIILETLYEDKFLDCSHGFRPNKSTHSALRPIYLKGHQHT